jgi:polyferredoxin
LPSEYPENEFRQTFGLVLSFLVDFCGKDGLDCPAAQGSAFQRKEKASVSFTEKARALNHWSAGLVFLGMILSLAPAAMEIGAGISAVGIACYAASRRRHPAWGFACFLPVLGALAALIVLTILSPGLSPVEDRPWPERAWFSPLLWTALFLFLSVAVWMNWNPSAVTYKSKAWKQSGMNRPDSSNL